MYEINKFIGPIMSYDELGVGIGVDFFREWDWDRDFRKS
jgi:hypothetical protein